MKKQTKSYIIGILIPLAVGGISAFLTRESMDIYSKIEKPPLSPPGILFPIVWTILYVLMGLGSAIIWNNGFKGIEKRNSALTVYAVQLIFNFFWSIWFFNLEAYLFSFVWLVVMWLLIILMIVLFSKINKAAAYLQLPYLLWVTFAGYLNLMIYILNG